ncbi:hypothetical protein RRG08_035487 [Elysia crispata]|uniref:Uncharacterized protein n=1 Tax=Elysia crispata TaxID=231223 RepID=A0AAE1E2H4_9GAST|nr:hypothetical protein RRG08_035487 [Elysia crispata]
MWHMSSESRRGTDGFVKRTTMSGDDSVLSRQIPGVWSGRQSRHFSTRNEHRFSLVLFAPGLGTGKSDPNPILLSDKTAE